MFLNCSTCYERQTARHQELKNCNCSLWFYIRLWFLAAVMAEWALSAHSAMTAAITIFELLMMGGVSLETCWTIKKHWNNKFYYTVASCFYFCKIYIMMHGSMNISDIIYKLLTTLWLTLRWLMSYIYGAPILDVSRSHTTTQHSR